MSNKLKFLIFLLAGAGTFFLINKKSSMEPWGRTGSYSVTKVTGGTGSIATMNMGDIRHLRVILETPPEETRFKEVDVPEECFGLIQVGDQLSFDMRGFPLLKMELVDYELSRNNAPLNNGQWKEGFPIFWFGVAGASLAVGIVVTVVLSLLALACGFSRVVKD